MNGEFVHRFDQVLNWTPRLIARHVALSGLSAFRQMTGAERMALTRPRVHFLYLHHVFEDEEANFRAMLDELSQTHTFISYSDAVEHVRRGEIDRPYIAFSFDDGLKTCLRAGQILAEYDASTCFFVCPPMAEETRFEVIRDFCRDQLGMPPTEFLNWQEIEKLVRLGHEIGSHTMSHPQLSEIEGDVLRSELEESRDVLVSRVGKAPHFAWPFGRFFHVNRSAVEAVFAAGYETCASAERGAHVEAAGPSFELLCIRRDQIVAAWPARHSRHFISRSSQAARGEDNDWPDALCPKAGRKEVTL